MNPIEALMNNDPAGFRDSVSNMLMQKLGDRLDLERINVAQNLFNETPDPEESEVEVDSEEGESFEDDEEGFGDDDDQGDFLSDDEE